MVLLSSLAIQACSQPENLGSEGNRPGEVALASEPVDESWHWMDVPGTRCGHSDAPTGIAINQTARSTKLMIYLEGGGACSTAAECQASAACPIWGAAAKNLDGYDAAHFAADIGTRYNGQPYGSRGIWERPQDNPSTVNPFQDYSFVFIPYCTGDFFRGNQTEPSPITGAVHAGYQNVTLDLNVIRRYFPNPSAVVLVGSSAGAFGALWNYKRIHDVFAPQGTSTPPPVTLLMEAGAPIPDDSIPAYRDRQQSWAQAWGLGTTSPAGPSVTHDNDVLQWLLNAYPNEQFALLESAGDGQVDHGDGILSMYTTDPYCDPLHPQAMTDGYFELRNQLSGYRNMAFYYPTWNMHGYIHNSHIEASTYTPDAFVPFVGDGLPQSDVFGPLANHTLVDWLRRLAR
jgi:hypothetical protein